MLFRLEPSTRLPRLPLWLLTIVGLMLCAVALIAALGVAAERAVVVCNLRRITGAPCPTCGSTRLVLAAISGRPIEAFWFNPLVMVALVTGAGVLGFRLLTAQRLRLNLTGRARRRACAIVVLLFLANWTYLWFSPSHQSSSAPSGREISGDQVDSAPHLTPVDSAPVDSAPSIQPGADEPKARRVQGSPAHLAKMFFPPLCTERVPLRVTHAITID